MKGAEFSSHRRAPTAAWQSQSHILVDTVIHDLQFNDNIVALDLRRNVHPAGRTELDDGQLRHPERLRDQPRYVATLDWKT
jgi:hypothetical protein